ncbi:S-layer homology domain-containing protein, partial [Nostoc sp. ChiQUE01b]|uniref:S-layer homology domain-containing protein n=1 Tax=Nostoc sp. ChiQUE01b TaxID=3075376 RepID=UPI002AD3BE9D
PIPTPTPTPTPIPTPTPTPTPIPTPTPTPSIELTDIANHWAGGFIRELVKLGIVNGFPDRTFKPDATMTRAQYAAILVKAFNPPPSRAAIKFKDVPADFWASKVIQQAYQGLFLSGFPDNTFSPNKNIQRVQVIVSLVNGLGLSSDGTATIKVFDDQAKIPEYAKDEVAKAIDKEIIVNYPNLKQLNPTRDATRAEVAAIVYQALVDAGRVAAINSSYIVTA